ncbi:MAG: glycosyltransferase [Lachnospiraceae bacterium]|nr:glycosyltransferase [Lachnospiraceae bacterium]
MRVLVLRLINSYIDYDVIETMRKLGCTVDDCSDYVWGGYETLYNDDKLMTFLEKRLSYVYDAVYTTNFFPVVAKVCAKKGIVYLSWYYDTPPVMESLGDMDYATNRMFFFCPSDYEYYTKRGLDNCYYLPLAVDVDRLESVIVRTGFKHDVSLVGRLYHSIYPALKNCFSGYYQGLLEGLAAVQRNLYDEYIVPDLLTDQIVSDMQREYTLGGERKKELTKNNISFAIAAWLNYQERITILALLSRRLHTALYTYEMEDGERDLLGETVLCKPVDYQNEMPNVFAQSKVNLCPILRNNREGVPLRVLDIMGSGGFLLASFQPGLERGFRNGEEIVMYRSVEEAVELAEYYAKHDSERERIVNKGKEKIMKEYKYELRVKMMLETVDN